jgi:uncharacterized protein (TIGR02118 family)
MFCASVAYPEQKNGTFDLHYFLNKHIPLFVGFLGDNCVRYEVQKFIASLNPSAPRFLYIAYFWLQSAEQFDATIEQHGAEIFTDIPQFTNIEPVREWREVLQDA